MYRWDKGTCVQNKFLVISKSFLHVTYLNSFFHFYCIILSCKFHLVSDYDFASEMYEGTNSRMCRSVSKHNHIPIHLHTNKGISNAEDCNVRCYCSVRPRISPRILLISDYTWLQPSVLNSATKSAVKIYFYELQPKIHMQLTITA